MAVKYSRQREAIKQFMSGRKDHPTAELVYEQVRKDYPNISLGTVYRNLTFLSNQGEISRINVGDGVDHFDPATHPHFHFLCNKCGKVEDVEANIPRQFAGKDVKEFDGEVHGSVTYFYGICAECSQDIR